MGADGYALFGSDGLWPILLVIGWVFLMKDQIVEGVYALGRPTVQLCVKISPWVMKACVALKEAALDAHSLATGKQREKKAEKTSRGSSLARKEKLPPVSPQQRPTFARKPSEEKHFDQLFQKTTKQASRVPFPTQPISWNFLETPVKTLRSTVSKYMTPGKLRSVCPDARILRSPFFPKEEKPVVSKKPLPADAPAPEGSKKVNFDLNAKKRSVTPEPIKPKSPPCEPVAKKVPYIAPVEATKPNFSSKKYAISDAEPAPPAVPTSNFGMRKSSDEPAATPIRNPAPPFSGAPQAIQAAQSETLACIQRQQQQQQAQQQVLQQQQQYIHDQLTQQQKLQEQLDKQAQQQLQRQQEFETRQAQFEAHTTQQRQQLVQQQQQMQQAQQAMQAQQQQAEAQKAAQAQVQAQAQQAAQAQAQAQVQAQAQAQAAQAQAQAHAQAQAQAAQAQAQLAQQQQQAAQPQAQQQVFGGQPVDGFGQMASSGFGQQQETASSGFGQSVAGFGQSVAGFGQSVDGFGQQQETASSGFGQSVEGFGQQAATSFGTSGFGQSVEGFGQQTATSFGTSGFGQSVDGFGQTGTSFEQQAGFGQQTGFGKAVDGFGQTSFRSETGVFEAEPDFEQPMRGYGASSKFGQTKPRFGNATAGLSSSTGRPPVDKKQYSGMQKFLAEKKEYQPSSSALLEQKRFARKMTTMDSFDTTAFSARAGAGNPFSGYDNFAARDSLALSPEAPPTIQKDIPVEICVGKKPLRTVNGSYMSQSSPLDFPIKSAASRAAPMAPKKGVQDRSEPLANKMPSNLLAKMNARKQAMAKRNAEVTYPQQARTPITARSEALLDQSLYCTPDFKVESLAVPKRGPMREMQPAALTYR